MTCRFFAIPATAPEAAQEDIKQFCATHRAVSTDTHLIDDGARSYWAVYVSYLEAMPSQHSSGAPVTRRGSIDYREVLDEHEFALFTRLRSLRKTLSEQDGIPAYALFTNEQLAAMVQQRVTSKTALGTINGVRTSRVDKYGDAFLQILQPHRPQPDEPEAVSPKAAAASKTATAPKATASPKAAAP